MAWMQVDFYSQILGQSSQVDVILPQKNDGSGEPHPQRERYPVLWLLHGLTTDHTIWHRYTEIERMAMKRGLCVIMPNAHQSFYNNLAHGRNYYTYFSEELPQIMREFFPISDRREDNYLCGLSMGGYGAMRIGLGKPEAFSAVGCLSAGNFVCLDQVDDTNPLSQMILGSDSFRAGLQTDADLFYLAEKDVKKGAELPKIFHCIGTEDPLLSNARMTRDVLSGYPCDYTYREGPGDHDWKFWSFWVQEYLNWLMPE